MQIRYYFAASVAALAIASVTPAPVMAQETTSSVRGTVTSDGTPVGGAEVVVTHVPSGTVSRTTTSADGSFNAGGLRIGGPVTVEVNADGFESAQVTDIFLSAGQPFRLPIEIAQANEIVVTASSISTAGATSSGPLTSLNREAIEGVTSLNRDIRDIARRDPFVTIDLSNSRTIEIAGQNGRLNRFSVDGVQFSDDFGLNNGGLPTSRGPVPFDAIEQLSVKVAPYDISEGDFQGGAINVVLRSGSNSFTGSGFFTYSDDSLTGSRTRGRNVDLNFDSKQYGGLIAGPIIKDKLFFMVAYERTEESDPFDDGVGPGFANQVPGFVDANGDPSTALIDQVSSIAQSVYNYDTLGLIQNAVEEDDKLAAKLDWNITEGQRASLTYIRNVGTQQFQQNTFTTPPFAIGLQSNGYELAEEVNSGVFQLNSDWSDDFSTEVRISYRDYNRDQTPFGGRSIAQFEVCTDAVSVGSATACAGSRVFFGPDVSRQSNDLNTENFSADFTANLVSGDHKLKFTAGYTDVSTFNLFLQRSLGDFYFDSLADFQNQAANRLRFASAVPSLDPNDAAARFSTQSVTFGLQDDWDVTPELRITYGARYDLYNNPERPALNTNFLQRNGFANNFTFTGKGVFQPRFGFNWQPTDRLVIRGGAGIFAGGTPDVFLSNSYSNTGQLTNSVDINRTNCAATNTCDALDNVTGTNIPASVGALVATNLASLAGAPVNAIDPDLDLASQLRATFSADYDADLGPLGDGWVFGADFLYGNVVNAYQWTDLRSIRIGTLPDGRPRYGRNPLDTSPTGATNQDLLLTNSTQGRSYIGVFRVAKAWDFGLSIDGSYTRSDVTDVNAITSATAGSLYSNNAFSDPNFAALGTSIYQIKDQWKFSVDFKRDFFGDNETRLSLFGEYRSGRPYSITGLDRSTGRSAVLGTVGNGGRALLYVPQVNDTAVSFDSAASETAFNSLISTLGLEKYRGRIVPKNSQQSPDFFKIDLHISQEIPTIVTPAKIKVFGDIENVLNLIDSDWGSLRQVSFPYTAAIVDVQCLSAPVATGTAPGAGVVNTASTQTCAQYRYSNVVSPNESLVTRSSLYQIRVGVKVEF